MKIVYGVFYDKNTGKITGVQSATEEEIKYSSSITGASVVISFDKPIKPDNYYVDKNGKIYEKQELIINYKDTIKVGDKIKITNIPAGATITWPDGFRETTEDTYVETKAMLEREYKFIIDHPHHYPVEVVINATA